MSAVQETERAIEALSLAERLQIDKDMPQPIGRDVEELDWQRLAIEKVFQDDSPTDDAYDRV